MSVAIIEERPLLTFALFAYQQERFIAEAVQGALNQTYFPLEIILSDDCSPDRTFEIMEQLAANYQGPHTIVLNRNEKNLGLSGHINRVMKTAKGELIVVAAGDDISLPHRTSRLWQEYVAAGGNAYSIFSNEYLIDEAGIKNGLSMQDPPDPEKLSMEWFAYRQASITGSSHAWHRAVFEVFGPLGDGVVSEDVAIPFRSLLLGSIRYVDEPLVLRRFTGNNLSLGSFRRWDSAASAEKFRKINQNHAKNFAAVYQTRLNDIDRMRQQCPDRDPELSHLRAITQQRLDRVRAETRFWESSRAGKLQILYLDLIRKGFGKAAARLAVSWVAPTMVMRFQHFTWFNRRGKLPQV